MPSTPRSRSGGGQPHGALRTTPTAPMSERQQLALVMQMTSQNNPPAVTNAPGEERRRSRQRRNERGETPLHVAAIRGDHDLVKELLEQGQSPNVVDFAGWTPLHEACNFGWLQVATVLVDAGADVSARGLDDDTPLHDAATSGNLALVKLLVDQGANPYAKNAYGKMPSDYAAQHIYNYLHSVKDSNAKSAHTSRARDEHSKKGNADSVSQVTTAEGGKRSSMEGVTPGGEPAEQKDKVPTTSDKTTAQATDPKDDARGQLSSSVVSSSQEDPSSASSSSAPNPGVKKPFFHNETQEADSVDDEATKRKKRKEADPEKEPMGKPTNIVRGTTGRVLTGTKPPGPASKTGAVPLGKGNTGQSFTKSSPTPAPSGKTHVQGSGKGSNVSTGGKSVVTPTPHQAKLVGAAKGTANTQAIKQEKKSPAASPKPNPARDQPDVEEEIKSADLGAPKVPPLKIVIPGGAGGAAARGEQEGEGGTARGSGKGRGSAGTLPYVIPCGGEEGVSNAPALSNEPDSGSGTEKTTGQRVLRSHRATDGDKGRTSPHSATPPSTNVPIQTTSIKSPLQSASSSSSGHERDDVDSTPSVSANPSNRESSDTSSIRGKNEVAATGSWSGNSSNSQASSVELHPRKRKIRASKESHLRESRDSRDSRGEIKTETAATQEAPHPQPNTHTNPYQMFLHIKKQIIQRQSGLFPVKPKPPKDFNNYLMNRRTYTLQKNMNPDPPIEPPSSLPPPMRDEYTDQEKERHRLRIQHLVEKEKLVLAVEQEILRVHGRAERAVANQPLPYSVCTILRDKEVYNVLASEQEEKRNAQRSRCNGRQINSWLQEVDDKWEKIKEGMLRRQHTEAETLHAVQKMSWEWKLKELGLCEHKTSPTIDATHVPQVHVSNFDLPA